MPAPPDATISYALQEAAVQVCGTAFYYKRPLRALLMRAGVPAALIQKYADESKFVIARSVFTELDDRGPAGTNVQRRLIRELVRVTPQDPDRREEALVAIRDLRGLANRREHCRRPEKARAGGFGGAEARGATESGRATARA